MVTCSCGAAKIGGGIIKTNLRGRSTNPCTIPWTTTCTLHVLFAERAFPHHTFGAKTMKELIACFLRALCIFCS